MSIRAIYKLYVSSDNLYYELIDNKAEIYYVVTGLWDLSTSPAVFIVVLRLAP